MSRHAEIDFGFSLVDEDDLANKDYERELEDKLQAIDHTAVEYKRRMLAVKDVVMPLLNGLTKDPSKAGLLWPTRSQKCRELIKRIEDIVKGDK